VKKKDKPKPSHKGTVIYRCKPFKNQVGARLWNASACVSAWQGVCHRGEHSAWVLLMTACQTVGMCRREDEGE
jgi:hypothetical protein